MRYIDSYIKKSLSLTLLLLAFKVFFTVPLYAQCGTVDFTSNASNNCLPALVKFTATGAPSGSTYYWDFGKGNVSGGQTMIETYTNPGTYDVKLEVRFPNGTICTRTKTAYLKFTSVSEPKFGTTDTQVCSKPATALLIDSTKNVHRREWYVDGSLLTDTARVISPIFTSPGYKTITIKVFDASGCSKVLSKNNYIFVHNEYALSFCTKMTEDKSRNTIKASFTPFVDPTASVVEYMWEFPGGTPSSYKGLTPPTVTYTNLSAPLDVTFAVKMKNGCTLKYKKEGLIRKYYSVLKNDYCEAQVAPLTIPTFPGFTLKKIVSNKKITYKAAKNNAYNITFGEAGLFDIKIAFATHNTTCVDTLILQELFTVGPARADFTADNPTQCVLPATVKLTATNATPISGTNTYKWEITDTLKQHVFGSPFAASSNPLLSYTFYDEGVFTVRLTVTNSGGCSAVVTKTAFIKIAVPVPNVVFPVNEVCAGAKIRPVNYSSPKAGIAGFTHSWLLKNRDSAKILIKGSGRTPTFTMKVPGVYDVEYTISNGTDTNCRVTKIYEKAITVNGIIADFTAGKRTGCMPFTTTLHPVIKVNKPDTAPSNALTYLWRSVPAIGVTFSDSTAKEPNVSFAQNGCYTITLIIKNAYGCSTTVTKKNLICFGTVADFTIQDGGCKDQDIKVTNTSKLSPNYYRWSVEPSANVIISPSATDRNPTFRFLDNGCYNIKLITGKKQNADCEDSITKSICIKAPVANFSTDDTSKNCAPVLVQFKNRSTDADSFFWDFGDGSTLLTADSTPIHIYEKNNPDGYTVKMVAIRKYGCRDSITINNYVKVYGPVPLFAMDKDKGCEQVTINFTNKSKYLHKFYMVYGDNSPIDTNTVRSNEYKFFDYTLDSNVFYPTLYSQDSTGCISFYKDTVIVYRPPMISFSIGTATACTDQPIQIQNKTKYADTYEWDFDNDGVVDDTNKNPVYVPASTGWKKITLTAKSKAGCVETQSKDSIFFVYKKPTSKFTASHTKACARDTISFFYAGTSDVPVVQYAWDFGDGTVVGDTSDKANPVYHYKSPGNHRAKLTITNLNGCTDTFSMLIETPDDIPPSTKEIHYVSVTPDNNIEIVYSKADTTDFDEYKVYQFGTGSPVEVFSSKNIDDTIGKSNLVNVFAKSYCYALSVEDECDLASVQGVKHCSIHLDVTANNGVSNRLNWSAYQGWENVARYEIMRSEDNGVFKVIASLPEKDTTYLDSQLCDKMYTYYIKAVHPNERFFSHSNRDTLRPAYVHQLDPLEMYRTTVLNNTYTYTSWRPSEQLNVKMYVIDKFTKGVGLQPSYKITTNNYLIDSIVDINAINYTYHVRVIDECGNVSPVSNPATTILLNALVKDDKRYLSWNKYYKWDNGVKEYLVQMEDDNKQFQTIAYLSAADTQFVDDSAYTDLFVPTCYRIVAVENSPISDQDSSISNTRCAILPARIFVPNAFTPNGDGHNDFFKAETLSLFKNSSKQELHYVLRVYNRLGTLLFETNDVNKGWDGMYKGAESPMETYFYIIEGHGQEGSRFFLDGTFHLLR